nr:splicing factor 3B subunit 4-like [Gorilla gorilla gorilla]
MGKYAHFHFRYDCKFSEASPDADACIAHRTPLPWRVRSEEEEGAWRQIAAPHPRAPASRPAQALQQGAAAAGGWGGGRGDDRGRGGALSAWAQLRWRGEVPGAVSVAASGEPARASAASSPHTAEALSVPRRGPSAGGPTRSPPPPTPPLVRRRSQREERPRAGRRTAGRGPPGPGGLRCSRVPSAFGPRRAQGERDPSSLLRQAAAPTQSLCHPPSLSPSPEATEPGRCPASPPFTRHHSPPPDRHPPSPISRDFPPDRPDPARDTTTCARARTHRSAQGLLRAELSRWPGVPASVQHGLTEFAELLMPRGRQMHSFHPGDLKKKGLSALPFLPASHLQSPPLILRISLP